MAPKAGSLGYLHLSSSFGEPRWRQAVIIKVQDGWLKTLVKCSQEEITESGLTPVTSGSNVFCLVEAEVHQLRLGVHGVTKELGHDAKELRNLATSVLESDEDLNWATASEPGKEKKEKKEKRRTSRKDDDDSGSSVTSEEDDLLGELKKSWLGNGSKDGKSRRESSNDAEPRRRSKRFSLIDRKRPKGKEQSASDKMQSAALQAAAQSSDPLHGLLALHLAESLKGKQKHRHRKSSRQSSRSRSSSTSSCSSDSSLDKAEKGHARAVQNYRKDGKKKFKEPIKHVRRYVKGIEEELGAEDKPFRITDYSKRIHFGKQQNLKRCHFLVSTILEYLLKEQPEKAALQAVVSLQAMHQASLDGSWDIAWLLTYQEDPFRAKTFGGDPNALQHVTAYLRSMHDLAKSTESLRKKGAGKGDDADQQKDTQKGKGKNGQKGREKDKDKATSSEA
jgi:hypothetical protein